jgi:deoxynucleoside triphosphate triphosphohydrolase SAMHD1
VQGGGPLPLGMREELRSRPVGVIFAGGTVDGRDRLMARLTELRLDATVDVGVTDLPSVYDPGLFENDSQRDAFLARCKEVAADVLLDESVGHDDAWAKEKLLGYGNLGYLVIFPYNTPTQSLSVLRSSGVTGEVPWAPLFLRRPKR